MTITVKNTNLSISIIEDQIEIVDSYINVNQLRRLEKIKCNGTILFRVISAIMYDDCEVIKSESFFNSKSEAENYWIYEMSKIYHFSSFIKITTTA
ncbi:MAG: hypothetical protein ACFFCQ_05710 [Promethearchaeota archaeon]